MIEALSIHPAMHPDLPHIRELQALDNRIRELEEEISRLPKYVARIESQLQSHKIALQADKDALEQNRKSRAKMDIEIADAQQKIARFRAQMNEARTNEQFRAFQHEIEFFEKDVSKVEDRILDKMVEAETFERNVKIAQAALDEEAIKVASEVEKVTARVAADQKEADATRKQRGELASRISGEVLRTYERVRRTRGGIAVARADMQYCLACNVMLRPQFSQTLRGANEILTCESCGRILYYEPPGSAVVVEDPAAMNS